MRQSKKMTPLVFRVGLALLFAALLSLSMMSGIQARYAAVFGGDGGAKVAKFSVTVGELSETSKTLDLTSANGKQSVSVSFTVENDSEIKAVDRVTVVLPCECSSGLELSVTVNGSSTPLSTTDRVTYTASAEFGFSDTHFWVLIFTGDPEVAEDAQLDDIKISVTVEQKD